MNDCIWKDRVWLCFVLGPLVWMALFLPFVEWSKLDGLKLVELASVAFVLNIGLVSACVPLIQGQDRKNDTPHQP